ncbi:SDR family NAD(P)-dependent oxidoreductase [Actinoplanes subtropicus]|uniref:SDR family NAD(P)-dependent oxidoreductase n=1 Tax=Actinoplanes subtropicus TaxID=543632 RepID=UPI0007C42E77|nr:SDR family NAD(P)-dependent oxidoreductase [Actinoplanes subtropicus]
MDVFEAKVAVVTGAAGGIGLGLVERFLAAGMHVMLSDIDSSALTREVERLRRGGALVAGFVADVSDREQVVQLAAATVERFGAVHVVCNNAGVDAGAPFSEIPPSVWDWVMGVNFNGVLYGCQVFLPLIREAGGGHIVNTASYAALSGNTPTATPYIASKFAVLGLSENLQHELSQAGEDIAVSVMCPGFVRTRLPASERNRPPGVADLSMHPVRRLIVDDNARRAEQGLGVETVAEQTFEAIRERRFYVLPHRDEALAATEARLRWMRDNVQPVGRPGRPGLPRVDRRGVVPEIATGEAPPVA